MLARNGEGLGHRADDGEALGIDHASGSVNSTAIPEFEFRQAVLDFALKYARAGLAVFPCNLGTKTPATRRGFYDATTNPATIKRWFGGRQGYNVAVRTGLASGVWVLDVDNIESLTKLQAEHGPLPATRQSQSRRGIHFWWRTQSPMPCSTGRVATGIDVKGDGGYVVAPPSVHPDGPAYRWLYNAPSVAAPNWLLKLTRERPHSISERALAGIRHPQPNGRPGAYGAAALDREIANLANTPPGSRNHALNAAAFSLFQLVAGGELDGAEVERRLIEAALANGLTPDDGITSVMRTIRSGARAGIQHPRSRPGGV